MAALSRRHKPVLCCFCVSVIGQFGTDYAPLEVTNKCRSPVLAQVFGLGYNRVRSNDTDTKGST